MRIQKTSFIRPLPPPPQTINLVVVLDLIPDVQSINHLSVNDVRLYPLFIFLVRNAEAVGHLKIQ
jgi:hypothetical protein